jgi:hypothetical protein
MRIKFTLEFYNAIDQYFPDDAFAEFMHRLLQFPAAGPAIKGLGGIRKIRAPDRAAGVGTRSGLRILYSYHPRQQLIIMYLVYRKRDQSDLLPHQRAYLLHLSLIDFEDEDVWYNPRNKQKNRQRTSLTASLTHLHKHAIHAEERSTSQLLNSLTVNQ